MWWRVVFVLFCFGKWQNGGLKEGEGGGGGGGGGG